MYRPIYSRAEQAAITRAINIIKRASCGGGEVREPEQKLESTETAKDLLRLHLGALKDPYREVFSAIMLDNSHRIIEVVDLFQGTIDGAAVYPREVARSALQYNAKAVILGHNHPSDNPDPSNADVRITGRLVEALSLLDIRVLDHIIVAYPSLKTTSLVERGLM